MLRDVVVERARSRAIPLAMITMKKSIHGFLFLITIWQPCSQGFSRPFQFRRVNIWERGSLYVATLQMSCHFRIPVQATLVPVTLPVRQDTGSRATDAFVLTVTMEIIAS